MLKRMKIMSLLVGLAILLTVVPSAYAQFTPAIAANDQNVVDGTVVVKMAIANGPSWVVIHSDDNGKPGPVIGQTAIAQGAAMDVVVQIDTSGLTDVLHAMLHDDTGVEGEYEFPTADPPTKIGDSIVMDAFKVTGESTSIVGAAKAAGNFNTLLAAVEAAGLTETLMQEGPLTVFAPTDEAFAKIPQATLDGWLADKDALTKVLTYHVVPGTLTSADIADGTSKTTIEGEDVSFTVADGNVTVNDASVTGADVEASNGIIHIVDTVLLPPSMAAAVEETAATEVVTPTEEVAATEEMTTTEEIASTEVMTDSEEMAASEEMTATEEVASSEAMTATEEIAATDATTDTESAATSTGLDVVDTAVAGEFNTLVTAIQAAGLVDALKGEGPFTVFAPTDDAFAKIPQETLDALLADPKGDLTQILLYHVVAGNVLSTDITDGMEVETLQGTKVKFTVKDGAVMINDAKVVAVDIPATNGVIHVIDTVLMPADQEQAAAAPEAPAETTSETAAAPEQMPATGGSTNNMITLLIVSLVVLGLAGSTLFNRRRTA